MVIKVYTAAAVAISDLNGYYYLNGSHAGQEWENSGPGGGRPGGWKKDGKAMDVMKTAVCGDHLIWLEPEHLHYHIGVVQAKALWGRRMKRESGADISRWTGYATDPAGCVLDADIIPGGEDYCRIAFFAVSEGIYGLVLESRSESGGVRSVQRARLSVPVGHDVEGRPDVAGPAGLDVYCEEYRGYGLGQPVTVRVDFDGKPLPGALVKATYHFFEGEGYPWQGETGKDGRAAFTFFEKGHWMFACTYPDPRGGAVYTASFVVPGVR